MNEIINLTQHWATPEQTAAGVIEPANKKSIQALLTFEELPSAEDMERRANLLALMVTNMELGGGSRSVMIGGAPYFMGALERALKAEGHRPMYAFSRRESEDQVQEDGSIRKVAVFRHLGFVEV